MSDHDRERPPLEAAARFEILTRYNAPELRPLAGVTGRVDDRTARLFDGPSLVERFVRALAERRALRTKELVESLELFERARRAIRGRDVVDLCCGHGLVGLCFAVFEKEVETVTLVDHRRPASFDVCLEAALEVAPWAAGKVDYRTVRLEKAASTLPEGAGVVAAHACGPRTDKVIGIALERARSVVLLPCCYPDKDLDGAPAALRRRFGHEAAADVHRTYRLTSAGWTVRWDAIPPEITPMNRVLVGLRGGA